MASKRTWKSRAREAQAGERAMLGQYNRLVERLVAELPEDQARLVLRWGAFQYTMYVEFKAAEADLKRQISQELFGQAP